MNGVLLIDLLLAILDRAQVIGALIAKAQSEGRDITDAELDDLVAKDDLAREKLQEAIDNARTA